MPSGSPKYVSASEFAVKLSEYFEREEHKPFTIAGLAYFLGFADRQSMYDYEKRGDDFSCALKSARLRIEAMHEGKIAAGGKCAGNIFWLKNHAGYTDKADFTSGGEKLEAPVIIRAPQKTDE